MADFNQIQPIQANQEIVIPLQPPLIMGLGDKVERQNGEAKACFVSPKIFSNILVTLMLSLGVNEHFHG